MVKHICTDVGQPTSILRCQYDVTMYLLFKAFLGGKDNSNHFRTDLNYNYSLVWYDMKKIKYRVVYEV